MILTSPALIKTVQRLAVLVGMRFVVNDQKLKALEKIKLPDGISIAEFQPCVIEDTKLGLTTYLHEDVAYYAKPMSGLHWVDALLAMDDNRLVGVSFWFTATERQSA